MKLGGPAIGAGAAAAVAALISALAGGGSDSSGQSSGSGMVTTPPQGDTQQMLPGDGSSPVLASPTAAQAGSGGQPAQGGGPVVPTADQQPPVTTQPLTANSPISTEDILAGLLPALAGARAVNKPPAARPAANLDVGDDGRLIEGVAGGAPQVGGPTAQKQIEGPGTQKQLTGPDVVAAGAPDAQKALPRETQGPPHEVNKPGTQLKQFSVGGRDYMIDMDGAVSDMAGNVLGSASQLFRGQSLAKLSKLGLFTRAMR